MNFSWFVNNPVKVGMFFLAMILMGYLSWRRLPLNLFPDIQTPRITIVASTIGMTPEEAERRLTTDLERQLSSIKGVSNITSYSRESHIVIHVDFHWGQDMEFAYLDVKKSISAMQANPNISQIDIYRFDPNAAALMTLSFIGNSDRVQLTTITENSLRPKLETIQGVAYVRINGGSQQEVIVHANDDVMAQFNLTADMVMNEIRNRQFSSTGGVITQGNDEMVLKFVSRMRNIDDIKRCVITVVQGHSIHLEDLGRIEIGRTRDYVLVHQEGLRTVSLDVFREPDANAVLTARRVRAVIESLNRSGDYNLKIAVDQSQEIESSIREVIRTALIGMLLAMAVLMLFLRSPSATMIVAMAIPISIIGTFCLMYFQGLSMNIMTLGGLALGAGMLVDNSIVVVENIFRHRQGGVDSRDAAARGAGGVAQAITAATLTTVVVFVPLVYVHGIAGILFKDQALTVVYSLMVSLLVALVLIPMLAARMGAVRLARAGSLTRLYGGFLSASMRVRWILMILFVAIMVLTWNNLKRIPSQFFPESISGRLTMVLEMPMGTSLRQTEEVAGRMEGVLLPLRYRPLRVDQPNIYPILYEYEQWKISGDARQFITSAGTILAQLSEQHPRHHITAELSALFFPPKWNDRMGELLDDARNRKALARQMKRIARYLEPYILIHSITSTIGMESNSVQVAEDKIFGPHTARMEIVMNPRVLRELSAADVIMFLREEAARMPDLKITFESKNEFLRQLLGKNRGDIVVEIHAERTPELHATALEVADRFSDICIGDNGGLVNVRTNLVQGDYEYILEPDQDAMTRHGYTIADISSQVQAYLRGFLSDRLKLEQGEMAIAVLSQRAEAEGVEGLLNHEIISKTNTRQKLGNLIKLRVERGVRELMRVNQERTLLVMGDLNNASYQQGVAAVQNVLDSMQWRQGTRWNISGEEVKRRESFQRLLFALIIAIILVYMVIASILESVVHPLTIMLSVPFALAGVIAAFLLLGLSLNLMGYIGIVMLVGIVVNNAIVLLDRMRQVRDKGAPVFDAVIEAGRQRLRPIVMTSLTTILALLPLSMGFGHGAEFRRPMAIAVIGGLVSSTLLTLWILPAIYLCVEDGLNILRRIFGIKPATFKPASDIQSGAADAGK